METELRDQVRPSAAPPPPGMPAQQQSMRVRAKKSAPVVSQSSRAVSKGKMEGKLAMDSDDARAIGKAGSRASQDSKQKLAQVRARSCSDVSRRPLAQRRLLWRKRFRSARGPAQLLARYHMARNACELPDWRSEAMFLRLLATQVDSEASAAQLLQTLRGEPTTQRYLAQVILRRAVDTAVVEAVERVLFGRGVDWTEVDRELAALPNSLARVDRLRQAMVRSPDDPQGIIRMVQLLARSERLEEALLYGERLRERGLMTPALARQMGDVLARNGMAPEAIRVYSEIVEFDPGNPSSRRMLGDIYLAHGWYTEAYRQYRTLTESERPDALSLLRLAAAAAGAGRTDEALRIERRVADEQGRPGPQDPRRWARLASAARLSRMLAEPLSASGGADPKNFAAAVERKLKQLQLFRGASTLVLLTWEDLDAQISLVTEAKGVAVSVGETTDASAVGMSAVLLSAADLAEVELVARLRSLPGERKVAMQLHTVRWDGRSFSVDVKSHEMAPLSTRVAM